MKEIVLTVIYIVAMFFLFCFLDKKYANNKKVRLIRSVATILLFFIFFSRTLIKDFQNGNYIFIGSALLLFTYVLFRAFIDAKELKKP